MTVSEQPWIGTGMSVSRESRWRHLFCRLMYVTSRTVSSYTADTRLLRRQLFYYEWNTRQCLKRQGECFLRIYTFTDLCVEKQDKQGSCNICMGAYITRHKQPSRSQYEITEIQRNSTISRYKHVSVYATKAYRNRGIAQLILKLGPRLEWLTSRPGHFTPGERPSDAHWIEGWVTPLPVWTFGEQIKSLAYIGNRSPDRLGRSLVHMRNFIPQHKLIHILQEISTPWNKWRSLRSSPPQGSRVILNRQH
jgi:hypothetical protein